VTTSGALSEAVARVEAELGAFWAATTDENGATKARAATMNFVVVSAPAEVAVLRAAIEDLAQTRAGRVFLMTVDGRLAPWDVESDVSAVCHKEGETVVCYDRIELHFGAMAAVRAPSVLSALSLSEVQTIVEIGKGAPGTLADGLARAADRVIVDSAHTAVTRIADLAQKTAAPLADRDFVRTFSWRDMVARFFDEAPGAERAVGRVEIERTTVDHHDPAALLLGWLSSRLGWRFESATRALDAHGMPIEILVRAPESGAGLGTGEMASIRLIAAIDGRPLFCACERKAGERVVRWSLSGPRSSRHEHPLGFRDEGWVLGKAIDSVEADRVYRATVIAAAEWARLAEGAR
jgi:glucose-6-phosphate dehydrogenase assembly protein OpcA